MRSKHLIAGIAMATVLVLSGSSTASAKVKNNQTSKNNQKQQVKLASVNQDKTVKVNQGDTLSSIADSNQTTYLRMFEANTNISDPDLIYPGDSLRIPAANEQLPERQLPAKAAPVVQTAPAASTLTQAPQQVSDPAPTRTVVQTPAPALTSGCGDNQYASFIYSHESGCRTTATSSNGCYGIGQACPASKLANCGADYACQNDYFTAYAAKYGGWAGAYSFWVSHGWW